MGNRDVQYEDQGAQTMSLIYGQLWGGAGWDQDTSVSLCSFSAVKDIVLQRMCVAPIEVSGTHWDVPVWCVAGEKGRVLPQAT